MISFSRINIKLTDCFGSRLTGAESIVQITFKENNFIAMKRLETFTMSDFFASCGGIFLSISVLISSFTVLKPRARFGFKSSSVWNNVYIVRCVFGQCINQLQHTFITNRLLECRNIHRLFCITEMYCTCVFEIEINALWLHLQINTNFNILSKSLLWEKLFEDLINSIY